MFRKALYGAVALTALSVGAAQAEDLKDFRIGLIGGENEADRLRNFQCLVDQLPAVLGVEKVSLFPAADYDGTIQGLLGGTLDYAELGASGYAKIYLENTEAVEPILTTVQTDGSTGYYSIMVATQGLRHHRARRHEGQEARLRRSGLDLGLSGPGHRPCRRISAASPVKDYFAETGFGGGHENLVLEVLKGTFDAGTTFGSGVGELKDGYTSGNLAKMVEKGILDMDDLVEVWKSPLIPNGPIVVRTSLDDGIKTKFKQFMVDLPQDRQGLLLGHPGRRLHRLHRSDAGILPAHHRRPQGADRLVSHQATGTRRGYPAARFA